MAKPRSKKAANAASLSGPVVPVGVVQPERLEHAIAHAGRLQLALEQNVNASAASRKLWEEALVGYQKLVRQAGSEAVEAAYQRLRLRGGVHDLDATRLTRAFKHITKEG